MSTVAHQCSDFCKNFVLGNGMGSFRWAEFVYIIPLRPLHTNARFLRLWAKGVYYSYVSNVQQF
jgi:hypothetical protein